MEKITIYPKKELLKKILNRCQKERRSMNNLILMILEKEVKNGEESN